MSDTHMQITPPKRRTVLVVDDEQINRELLGTLLEDDYRVLYAANGQEALELAKKRAEDISLILRTRAALSRGDLALRGKF